MSTTFHMPDFMPLLPEMVLFGLLCVILIADLFVAADRKAITAWASVAAVIVTAVLSLQVATPETVTTFNGMFVLDPLANLLKPITLGVVAACFIYAQAYLKTHQILKGEFYILGLLATLGMLVLISAGHFLTIYLGLELMSLSLYAMVAYKRNDASASEAAMKYFVLGAIASGMLLYGMSILYGVTGELGLSEIATYLASHDSESLTVPLAITFIVASLAFKLGAVPFHMWIPDVYQGAPAPVSMFVGSAPKIASLVMTIRLLTETLPTYLVDWQQLLIALAMLSLLVGNVVAIAQTSIKRMLGYSTVSHVGFVLLGLLIGDETGYASATFYIVVYAVMSLAAFGVVTMLSQNGIEADHLDSYKGLNERNGWYALIMLITMISMAGVPMTGGFFAKLSVIMALVGAGWELMAVYAVVLSIVGAFYYLRVVWLMYFDKLPDGQGADIDAKMDMRLLLSLNGLLLIVIGVLPDSLLSWCQNAFLS